MIISHKHKFIFLKTEKTAGTSFEIALSSICGSDDIITPISPKDEAYRQELGFRCAQNYRIAHQHLSYKKRLKSIMGQSSYEFYNHMPAKEVKSYVHESVWQSYFKFAFVRNPFDKVVSGYFWFNQNRPEISLLEYLQTGEAKQMKGPDVYMIGHELAVDRLFKFEELEDSISFLNRKLGLGGALKLPAKKTKSHTRTDKRHYRDILSPKEVKLITEQFKEELERFDYKF